MLILVIKLTSKIWSSRFPRTVWRKTEVFFKREGVGRYVSSNRQHVLRISTRHRRWARWHKWLCAASSSVVTTQPGVTAARCASFLQVKPAPQTRGLYTALPLHAQACGTMFLSRGILLLIGFIVGTRSVSTHQVFYIVTRDTFTAVTICLRVMCLTPLHAPYSHRICLCFNVLNNISVNRNDDELFFTEIL